MLPPVSFTGCPKAIAANILKNFQALQLGLQGQGNGPKDEARLKADGRHSFIVTCPQRLIQIL